MKKKKRDVIRFEDEFGCITYLRQDSPKDLEELFVEYLESLGEEEAALQIASAYEIKSIPGLDFVEWGIRNRSFLIIPEGTIEEK